jgi:hypothetical protein
VRERLTGRAAHGHAWHRHSTRSPLWKALAAITAETGRCDPRAALAAIDLLVRLQAGAIDTGDDKGARGLLEVLRSLGVAFLGIDDERIRYRLRGTEKAPISSRRLTDILREVEVA